MVPRRMRARLAVVTGVLTAVFLALASSVLVGSASAAAPTGGFGYLCANGGAGLCLQENGNNGSLVANDNKIAGGPPKQQWAFLSVGVTSANGPFSVSGLNGQVAAGRAVGRWEGLANNTGSPLCLAERNDEVVMALCSSVGTEWVLSGSGRMINVESSNNDDVLSFLNSTGVNSETPVLESAHPCPGGCWGPAAG
jgi:hypothetical protein